MKITTNERRGKVVKMENEANVQDTKEFERMKMVEWRMIA